MKETLHRIQARPYDWPHEGSLNLSSTALVVVDMQRDCTLSKTREVTQCGSDDLVRKSVKKAATYGIRATIYQRLVPLSQMSQSSCMPAVE